MSQIVVGKFPSEIVPNSSSTPLYFYPNGPKSDPVGTTVAQRTACYNWLRAKLLMESSAFSTKGFDQTNWRGFECAITGTPDVIPPPLLLPLRLKKTDNRELWSKRRSSSEIIVGDYAKGKAIVEQELGQNVITSTPRYGNLSLNSFNIGVPDRFGAANNGMCRIPGVGWVSNFTFTLHYSYDKRVSGLSPASAGFTTNGLASKLTEYTDLVLDSSLITEVLAKANQGDLDLLTFYAEIPETLRSFYDLLKRLIRIAKDLNSKEFRLYNKLKKNTQNKGIKYIVVNGVQVADEIASLRLRYRYEIEPLVLSLVDLAKSLNVPIRTFHTTKKRVVEYLPEFGYSGWISQEQHGTCESRAWCKRAYTIDENTQFTRAFSQDLAVTAFELITGSFILDWCFNFGDFIAAQNWLSADAHSHEGFTYSQKFKSNMSLQPIGTSNPYGPRVRISLESYELKVINPRKHICVIPENGLFGNVRRELDLLAFAWISYSTRAKPKWLI